MPSDERYSSFDRSNSFDEFEDVELRIKAPLLVTPPLPPSRQLRQRAESAALSCDTGSETSEVFELEEGEEKEPHHDDFASVFCDWGCLFSDPEEQREEFEAEEKEREEILDETPVVVVPVELPEVFENVAQSEELSQPHDFTSVFCEWGTSFGVREGERDSTLDAHQDVIVAVESTAFTSLDDSSKEMYSTNFVGVVRQCDPTLTEQNVLEKGTRVAAIAKWATKSSHVSIASDRLWVIPKDLDSADVSSLMAAYLPAFTALHHGRARPYCYSITCLTGRRLLITGGLTAESRALIRMAKLAGVEEIFVQGKGEMKDQQVHMLEDWGWVVEGSIDIVVDYAFPNNFKALRKALARHGRLVCVAKQQQQGFDSILEQIEISKMKRATLMDFAEHVRVNRTQVCDDMKFLLEMLSSRFIRPKIDKYIPLNELSTLHNEFQNKPLTGAIVCDLSSRHGFNDPAEKSTA